MELRYYDVTRAIATFRDVDSDARNQSVPFEGSGMRPRPLTSPQDSPVYREALNRIYLANCAQAVE